MLSMDVGFYTRILPWRLFKPFHKVRALFGLAINIVRSSHDSKHGVWSIYLVANIRGYY